MELRYNKYWERGKDFLNVDYPVISGAMTWISNSNLVRAVSDAGGFGVLAAGNMPPELLEEEIHILKDAGTNFGVNLITIAPNFKDHLDLAASMKVPYLVFAGSFPRRSEIKTAKESGAKVMCFASTESIAGRMIDAGADALILEGSEAGGHIGHVSTVVLIQQVLFKFDEVPIFIAGGIATGRMVAHMLLMGAAGVQLGTLFATCKESPAHPAFKRRYIRARAREAYATPQYDSALPVVAVRALVNRGTREFSRLQLGLLDKLKKGEISRTDAQYQVENFWMGALRKAVLEGDLESGSLMAGQSVGLVKETKPVKDIINNIVSEAEKEFDRIFK